MYGTVLYPKNLGVCSAREKKKLKKGRKEDCEKQETRGEKIISISSITAWLGNDIV